MPLLKTQNPYEVEFQLGSKPTNPLPPPGLLLDGQTGDSLSCYYPAEFQTTALVLETSVAIGDVLTLTLTPITTATGSAWGDELGPAVISFEATSVSLQDAAQGLVDAAAAAQGVSSLADIAGFQRVRDIAKVTKTDDADADIPNGLQVKATLAGASFTVTLTTTGLTTSTQTTTGTNDDVIAVGQAIMLAGYDADDQKICRLPQAGDTADMFLGVAMDSGFVDPLEAGALRRVYRRRVDLPYRNWGTCTAQSSKAVAAMDSQVYVRLKTGINGEQIGDLTDTIPADPTEVLAIPSLVYIRTTTGAGTSAVRLPLTAKA